MCFNLWITRIKKKRKIRRRRWATQTLLLIKYLHIIFCNIPFIYTDFAEQRGWIETKTSLSPQERMFAILGRFFALVSPVHEFESRLARTLMKKENSKIRKKTTTPGVGRIRTISISMRTSNSATGSSSTAKTHRGPDTGSRLLVKTLRLTNGLSLPLPFSAFEYFRLSAIASAFCECAQTRAYTLHRGILKYTSTSIHTKPYRSKNIPGWWCS